MKRVTVNFKNSGNQDKEVTLDIYTAEEKASFRADRAGKTYDMVSGQDWEDDGFARIEKMAAAQAGISNGEKFYWIRQ